MVSILHSSALVALIAFAGLISATGNTFSVPLVHNPDAVRHGPTELLRTMKKYNLAIPDGLQDTVDEFHAKFASSKMVEDGGDSGTVQTISKEGDLLWITAVGVGSPSQQLYMDLDTGSTDTWVFSTETNKKQVNGQTLYDPSQSTTAEQIPGCKWDIIYGDFSSSSGSCWKDTFTLGNLSIPGMTIESAQQVSKMFTESDYMSGLVGLAWPDIAQTTPKQKALIEYLSESLDEPVFTVDFRHNSSDGSFNFGFVDDGLHDDDIEWTAVDTSEGFWSVTNTAFGVGQENLTYSYLTPRNVIVDTGTTLLFAPEAAVETYYSKIDGAKFSGKDFGYVVPCNTTPPDFVWELRDDQGGTVKGAVPGEYVPYALAANGTCFAGIQSVNGLSSVEGIFGDVWLKSLFAVFDIKGKRYGAASKPLNLDNGRKRSVHKVELSDNIVWIP
ncbi:aspartic peptidase domain-containing protein [Xylariaceae sp. FL1272]|nr:aspartic peptidase domain-containing protein [Xylariaceae sp. FL1272]